MCKKQTSISHSCTESEIVSLDVGLGMDGLLALALKRRGDRSVTFVEEYKISCRMWTTSPQSQILLKVRPSCTFFEHTEAVIKTIIKGQKSHDETRIKNPQSCA